MPSIDYLCFLVPLSNLSNVIAAVDVYAQMLSETSTPEETNTGKRLSAFDTGGPQM